MKLTDLLKYDDIVIQCHNVPDADALASGFAVYTYLKEQGKKVRFVYGGSAEIQKRNLLLMVEHLGIPVEHVSSIPEPELLVMVDCQPGESNTRPPVCGHTEGHTVAVIDHHQQSPRLFQGCADPERTRIAANYGSCATVVCEMLREAGCGWDWINGNPKLATALYYGLYTDTGALQEIFHPADKDARDQLHFSKNVITLFRNANISWDDLDVVKNALDHCRYDEDYRFAIVRADTFDTNILGIISDMIIEVDGVDICVVYCMLPNGAKLSIRSYVKETRADDLAAYLCGGGGHETKAGGFLKVPSGGTSGAEEAENAGDPGQAVWDLLEKKTRRYLTDTDILDVTQKQADTEGMRLYRKNPVKIGYVRGSELITGAPEKQGDMRGYGMERGDMVRIRFLTGDFEIRLSDDINIMVSENHEVYPIRAEVFNCRYTPVDDPYLYEEFTTTDGYQPKIIDIRAGDSREFIPFIRTCESRPSFVYARRLERRLKLFTNWDGEKYLIGEPGDWLAVRVGEDGQPRPDDAYIVKEAIFRKLYSGI